MKTHEEIKAWAQTKVEALKKEKKCNFVSK